MIQKQVYLAGPITGLTYHGCTDWRKFAAQELSKSDIRGVSPMRAKEYLAKLATMPDSYPDVFSNNQAVTVRDRYDVMASDLVLFNLLGAKRISIGTLIEFGWADAFRKPIVVAMEKQGNLHEHAHIRGITGFRVESLEQAIDVSKAILIW